VRLNQRNNINIIGSGPATIVFAHGFGCDQNMWRFLAPVFSDRYKVVLFDLVGSGRSDLTAYDRNKYNSLQGYADDLIEIIKEHSDGPVIFVGHSVSAMIGVIADVQAPELFAMHVMIGPSPCYINSENYEGGFTREDIDSLLNSLESNYLGWSSTMAPAIMGSPGKPELGAELTNSFCSTDPEIAKQFARVTFLSDNRADLSKIKTPVLILQCSDDMIAPLAVGTYMNEEIVNSVLRVVDNVGHCPHLSEPDACIDEMRNFVLKIESMQNAA
jgi:sigma-B regulation protein RsbQ